MSLSELPVEILCKILEYTDSQTVVKFSEASKECNQIAHIARCYHDFKDSKKIGNLDSWKKHFRFIVDLSSTPITRVEDLDCIYSLNLSGTRVSDVSALENVQVLYLKNLFPNIRRIQGISKLKNICFIDLSHTAFEWTELMHLKKLKTLVVDKSAFRKKNPRESIEIFCCKCCLK